MERSDWQMQENSLKAGLTEPVLAKNYLFN